MKQSIWHRDTLLPEFPPLYADLKTDVLIVGGGLAGLLCARKLEDEGVDYALIEADRLMGGVSGNTTAKITSQHGAIYSRLLKKLGQEKAKAYWEMNEKALGDYRKLCEEISCDFETKPHVIFSTDEGPGLEEEMAALEKLGIPAQFGNRSELPFPVAGEIRFANQAQFDPMKFAAGITENLKLYEKTKALEFSDNRVKTNRGMITASKIIMATHFPILNKHGMYFLKMYQQRSYVLALQDAQKLNAMYLDIRKNGLSFRNCGNTLLLGGGGHRTGKQGGGWIALEDFAKAHYPQSREVCRWAAQDCMTLDGMPYVGQYGRLTPNLYVATGFNKWGMTTAMTAAGILTDMVLGRKNEYARLLFPGRSIFHGQLLSNVAESTVNLLTPTKPRCPHLGCALKWNPQEHSWDCPCHGSRFSEKGKRLDGPSTEDKPM